ncbi:MAG: diacylglycerol kinase family protein [Cyanobacteria bacterium SIG31]|nr:diacylglycerol kinase family protein [Cyanobacteria bacterium SIG31]
MTKFKAQGFNNTFRNARKGFRLVLKSEMNIRIHVVIALLVLFFAYLLNFSALEYCVLFFAIAIVIISEMFNTAIEFTLDAIFHNRYSRMVGMAKDISAGAVMFASFISVFVGLILFGKHLL